MIFCTNKNSRVASHKDTTNCVKRKTHFSFSIGYIFTLFLILNRALLLLKQCQFCLKNFTKGLNFYWDTKKSLNLE